MPIGEIFRVALEALRVNKMRSLLTMLGIIIGVGAVIAMLALGNGAQSAVKSRIAALGTTMVTVVPGQVFTGGIASQNDRAQLKVDDAAMLEQRGTTFQAVEPEMSRNQQVQYVSANTSTNVTGAPANFGEVRKYSVAVGHMFTESDDA